MQALAPASVLTKTQLFERLKSAFEKLVREEIAADVDPWRIYQLRQAQKNDLYFRGLQYIARTWHEGITDFSSIGTPIAGSDDQDVIQYVQNIYRGYAFKVAAVLGQRVPNVTAMPDDPEDEELLRQTSMADTAAAILDAQWKTKIRNIELALNLWKNSTTFAYTPWIADGFKYGHTEETVEEPATVKIGPDVNQCLNCGAQFEAGAPPVQCCQNPMMETQSGPTMDVPQPVGVEQYENGAVEFHLTNIFTTSVPFYCHDLSDAPWLSYKYDELRNRIKRWHPVLRKSAPADLGGSDSAATSTARIVQQTAQSPIGTPSPSRENKWAYERVWLKPEMFESLDDEARDLAVQYFKDGVKLTLVEGVIPDENSIEAEKMTDVWSACKPAVSEYFFADAIGQDMIPIQDLRNDVLNIAYQTIESGLPLTFVDPRQIDAETWARQTATPNAVIPVLAATGASLADGFFQTEPSRFSDQMIPWVSNEEATARINVGTTEAIYGGNVPGDDQTAHEAELRKNAALQQLSMTWMYMAQFWQDVKENGVRQLARYGRGVLRSTEKGINGFTKRQVDLAALQEDGWHFQAEEGFPVTHAEKRARLLWILSQPEVAQSQGFNDPANVIMNHKMLGFDGYQAPGLAEHQKAISVIRKLVQQAPIRKPNDQGGEDLQPSIPIDDFDNHALMAMESYRWCITTGEEMRGDYPDGFDNVKAWGKAHFDAANPPKPPDPPLVKGSVSVAVDKIIQTMGPEAGRELLQQLNLTNDTPPASPAPEGSAPAPKGKASQAAPAPPPGVSGAPTMVQ